MMEFAAAADDAASVDEVVALFVDDAVFDMGGELHQGTSAIARYLQGARDAGFAGPAAGTRHIVTNCLVTVESNETASGQSEWMLIRSAADEAFPIVLSAGRYRDRYRRVDGVWRIAHRAVEY
ncbi:hypothetical protein CH272_18585 [Rhodococcus sp. 05-340-1]|nr:hypothetical protein CH254_14215 [Rhodococcus sp. 06-412-2C]OZC96371.1 hypothetical protein CH279_14385 [Rhodococcus sp. 06-412-2B]OZD65355.1 hypothetical protein CH271_20205 [Rhodococcus sp. 05-340-2]OZD74599.1 hypothetical protein CH272_18585 [Rhodococcus sp. 05-340-1]OZD86628.1 hypothetical protein CH273_00440 [Rhodococcus sp. 05-339-2]